MSDLNPDHLRILALAKAAISVEKGKLWTTSPMEAVERHGTACDCLWDELGRQVDRKNGQLPVLEHLSVKEKKLAMRMRREIVNVVNCAIEEALNDLGGSYID